MPFCVFQRPWTAEKTSRKRERDWTRWAWSSKRKGRVGGAEDQDIFRGAWRPKCRIWKSMCSFFIVFFFVSSLHNVHIVESLLSTGLLKMIVRVLTTCHTQYTWDRSICIFLFNRTTLQVFVTYLTGALYVHPLWLYKHQHDNRVRYTQNAFSLPFAAILVNCAPSGEIHNYCTSHIIKENFENFLIHRCNYILLSQVYCVWQVVKTLIFIFNNPVQYTSDICSWGGKHHK